MPITPGTYLRLRREAAALTLEDVALRTDTVPPVSARSRAEWIAAIEADLAPVSPGTAIALVRCFPFDGGVLDALIQLQAAARTHAEPPPGVFPPRLCRVCACSQHDPCVAQGLAPFALCHWAEPDLCSACVTAEVERHLATPVATPPVDADDIAGAGNMVGAGWAVLLAARVSA